MKMQENFNLKNIIDQQKTEIDKLKKKTDAQQDQYDIK
jgi:hypothetical protein